MNKYTARGLALSMAATRRRALVVSKRQRSASDAFAEVAGVVLNLPGTVVRRSNGRERVEFLSGGRIDFTHVSSVRGLSADVLILDGSHAFTQADVEAVLPVLAGSPHAELVHA